MILIRNDDRDHGLRFQLILDPEDRRERPGALHRSFQTAAFQVRQHCPLGRVNGVRLGIDIRCHRLGMGSPVIQDLRHMDNLFRPGSQSQDHIVILAAVKLRPEQPRLFQQFLRKYRKMTDIIVGPQIINRKIRFEMNGQHIINAVPLKSHLVTVNIIRILLTDHLHILIKH